MLDPDAPSRGNPTERSFIHWMVVNIPLSNVSKGQTIVEYFGSDPPLNTGFHRYTFLLFKQDSNLDFDEAYISKTSFEERKGFSIQKFTNKYNLGHPVGGNFFLAEYEAIQMDIKLKQQPLTIHLPR
ncbi:hypothetical protein RI129_000919 [Pyrocoelia pectoralis]|uniref:Phosphatidylethanolamine-binding protein n=1 Tax=Pyrocoelia pectoralis TaxID=417401 RepID=A0AAN7VLG2_9COLE